MYNFDQQIARGVAGEEFLDAIFSPHYWVQAATPEQQRQGIDRLFTHHRGKPFYRIEYKTDSRAAQTGNAFIETVSVDRGRTQIPGWSYTSKSDRVVYFLPQRLKIYLLDLELLRPLLPEWHEQYPSRAIPNSSWKTHGLLVRLNQLEECCAAIAEFPATFTFQKL